MFLGLDLGTTNVKALVVAADGRIISRGSAPVRLIHTPDGGVEQDIEEIWQATIEAVRAAGDVSAVQAVGVSAQGGALQPVDKAWRPVGRVISWLDVHGRPFDDALTQELGREWFVAHIGHARSNVAAGQVLRLRSKSPDLLKPPNGLGFVGDVIVSRLCGRAAHDGTSLSIAWLYNPKLKRNDPDLVARLGLSDDRLPALLRPTEPAAGLRPEAAKATGLRGGIPVGPAVHDQYAAALGAGVTHEGDAMFGAGTAWVLLAAVPKLAPPVVETAFVCTHLIPGLYGHMLSMVNGGSAFKWVLEMVGLSEKNLSEIDRILDSIPSGAEGLLMLPLLVDGKGRFSGLRLSHRREHLVRAAIEGLACELTRHLGFLTGGGIPVSRLVMTGGAAASRATPQIVSDFTGLPLRCTSESEISALGAAMLGRALCEKSPDLTRISEEMGPQFTEVRPGANRGSCAAIYGRYLREIQCLSMGNSR